MVGSESAVILDWKSLRQEVEVGRSGRLKSEVSLRCWARPMPKRGKRIWQHETLVLTFWQRDWSHAILRT